MIVPLPGAYLAGLPKNALAVTLRGEVFHATGQVSAGKPAKAAALGRPRLRRELQGSLQDMESHIQQLDSELQKLSGQIESARDEVAHRQDTVSEARAQLESARNNERQFQVREELARRQWDFQVSQRTNIESEVAQAEKEREKTITALSAGEKEIGLAQESLRTQSAALAAITLDESQEQVKFWSTSSAVTERALSDAARTPC